MWLNDVLLRLDQVFSLVCEGALNMCDISQMQLDFSAVWEN